MIKIMIVICSLSTFALSVFDEYTRRKADQFLFRSKKQDKSLKVKAGCIEYYRIYKSMYMQQSVGISPIETMKRLHFMTEHRDFKRVLLQMSEVITNSNSVEKGVEYLKKHLVDEDRVLFLNILENSSRTGFTVQAMKQLDHLFFQKYLVDIKNTVKRVKRKYFQAAFLFCFAICVAIFLPIVDQMIRSLQFIFTSY